MLFFQDDQFPEEGDEEKAELEITIKTVFDQVPKFEIDLYTLDENNTEVFVKAAAEGAVEYGLIREIGTGERREKTFFVSFRWM